jgi:hypothetical protein
MLGQSDQAAMEWFNETFGADIDAAVNGTPFGKALVIAIAMQETAYLWRGLYKTRTVDEVLRLCVGDTIDAPKRSAFPTTRAKLEAVPQGKAMFRVAREDLAAVAEIDRGYARQFEKPDKFCHGFGMFQFDLQFFEEEPDYFLERKWTKFPNTLDKLMIELKAALKRAYGPGKTSLTHKESVFTAIAYNRGSVNTNGTFKQGHKNADGKFYGELLDLYLTAAEAL